MVDWNESGTGSDRCGVHTSFTPNYDAVNAKIDQQLNQIAIVEGAVERDDTGLSLLLERCISIVCGVGLLLLTK